MHHSENLHSTNQFKNFGSCYIAALLIMCYIIEANCTDFNSTLTDEKYLVYRLLPNDTRQLESLQRIWMSSLDYKLNFWKDPRGVGMPCDIMVSSKFSEKLMQMFLDEQLSYSIIIDDVEKLIIDKEHRSRSPTKSWQRGKMADQYSRPPMYNFYAYHSYQRMVYHMYMLRARYPKIAEIFNLGITHEGRVIKGLKISYPTSAPDKPSMWIDAGMHAREWLSHTTAMYIIHTLTTRYGRDDEITYLVNNFTWFIVPCVNPDGYEYSRSSTRPEVRFWRKNRAPTYQCSGDKCCVGVDLNRNFDFHWNEVYPETNTCGNEYAGQYAQSERETVAVHRFVSYHKDSIKAFITLHSYGQYWLFPYGHQQRTYSLDYRDLKIVARNATEALSRKYGTWYTIGTGADLLYPASGSSEDWAKGKIGIKFVYLIELRPDGRTHLGFFYPPEKSLEVGEETLEGIKVVAKAVGRYSDIKRGLQRKQQQ